MLSSADSGSSPGREPRWQFHGENEKLEARGGEMTCPGPHGRDVAHVVIDVNPDTVTLAPSLRGSSVSLVASGVPLHVHLKQD